MHPIAIAGVRSGIAGFVMLLYLVLGAKRRKCSSNLEFGTLTRTQILGALTYAVMIVSDVAANKMTTAANAINNKEMTPIKA